ncbi:putative inner membrane domain protein, partial [Chlamydia psittaci 84-8471/1]
QERETSGSGNQSSYG